MAAHVATLTVELTAAGSRPTKPSVSRSGSENASPAQRSEHRDAIAVRIFRLTRWRGQVRQLRGTAGGGHSPRLVQGSTSSAAPALRSGVRHGTRVTVSGESGAAMVQ